MLSPLGKGQRPRDRQSLAAIGGGLGCQGDEEAFPRALELLKEANEVKFAVGRLSWRNLSSSSFTG